MGGCRGGGGEEVISPIFPPSDSSLNFLRQPCKQAASAGFPVSCALFSLSLRPLFSDTLKAYRRKRGDDLVGRELLMPRFQSASFHLLLTSTHAEEKPKCKHFSSEAHLQLRTQEHQRFAFYADPLGVDLPVATLPYLWSSFYFSSSWRVDFLFPLTGWAGGGGLLGFWSRLVNGADD